LRLLLPALILAQVSCGGPSTPASTAASTPPPPPAPSSSGWRVTPNPAFRIQGGATSNAGFLGDEVWLTVGTPQGMRLYRSRDGSNQSTPEIIPGLSTSLDGTSFGPTETVPRLYAASPRELYVLGLAPPGTNRAVLYRLQESGGSFVRNPSRPVFEALASDNTGFIGVPDVYRTPDGRHRLIYVDKGGSRQNARTAISSDQGATFTIEGNNPFGDLALSGPADTNVDPAVLALASGGYLAVTMRLARLYIFTGVDGATFAPQAGAAIEAASFVAGATGLFDPTLVQLPDGTVLMYATLEDDQNRSSVVQAALRFVSP